MPVVCKDTALYNLSVDHYHYSFEDPAQLGSSDASREFFLDKGASMLGLIDLVCHKGCSCSEAGSARHHSEHKLPAEL